MDMAATRFSGRLHLATQAERPTAATGSRKRVHDLRVERCDGLGLQRDLAVLAALDRDPELMGAEVEFDLEHAVAGGHRRRRQSTRRHVQRDLPPVVDHRRLREANLADDLRPAVQRLPCRGPVLDTQCRPARRSHRRGYDAMLRRRRPSGRRAHRPHRS
jgi:hypothetical protein